MQYLEAVKEVKNRFVNGVGRHDLGWFFEDVV